MKAKSLRIRNVGGIENLEVQDVGGGLRIRGRNGAGKTSFISALQALFQGGSRPELIRQGAEDAEIEIVLEEGDLPPLLLKRRLTPKGSTIKIQRRDGDKVEEVKRPQEFIASILDALSFDPVAFLTAKPEERNAAVLQALPMPVPREELEQIGREFFQGRDLQSGHALIAIDQVHERIYDERTAVNRVVKEKVDTANQLRDSLPPAEELKEDWSAKLKALIQDRDTFQAAKADELKILQDRSLAKAAPVQKEYVRAMRALRDQKEAALKKIHEEHQAAEAKVAAARQGTIEEIWRNSAEEERAIADRYAEQLQGLAGEISQAQEKAQGQARSRGALETVLTMEDQARKAKAQSDDLTARLNRLDRLKAELLGKLPVKGLEVKGGKFFFEGIPFDQVNLSRRIILAVEILKLRAGKLKLVILDNAEHLDRKHREELESKCREAGFQLFETIVDDEAGAPGLQISAVGAGARP